MKVDTFLSCFYREGKGPFRSLFDTGRGGQKLEGQRSRGSLSKAGTKKGRREGKGGRTWDDLKVLGLERKIRRKGKKWERKTHLLITTRGGRGNNLSIHHGVGKP